jgi:hypothetical protein
MKRTVGASPNHDLVLGRTERGGVEPRQDHGQASSGQKKLRANNVTALHDTRNGPLQTQIIIQSIERWGVAVRQRTLTPHLVVRSLRPTRNKTKGGEVDHEPARARMRKRRNRIASC